MKYQSSAYRVGLGLCPSHYSYLEQRPATEVAWFEATSEDYLNTRGRPFEVLKLLRQDYPIALHGSGLNLGCVDGVSLDYLNKLRDLIENVEPFAISDHICWTGTSQYNLHEPLPLPFTQESLKVLCNNIDFAQNQLKTSLLLENISSYLSFDDDEMTEPEFITELTRRTGCGLLLNLNNVHINSANYGLDAHHYLKQLPMDRVLQIHLAGPSNKGKFLIDNHAEDIPEPVWELLRYIAPQVRHLPIAIERDGAHTEFNDLEMEVVKASFILEDSYETQRRTEPV